MLVTPIQKRPVVAQKREESLSLPVGKGSNYGAVLPAGIRGELNKLLIQPISQNLQSLVQKIKGSNVADKLVEENLNIIRENRVRVDTALDQLRQAEVQEGIASVGLRGFRVQLDLEGIQIDVSSTAETQTKFFEIIRRYVFSYSRSLPWPPKPDSYKLFKYDARERQDVCFFWPMYGYIMRLFLEQAYSSKMNITDLFILKNMKAYCADPFRRRVREEDKGKKEQNQLRQLQALQAQQALAQLGIRSFVWFC